MKSVLYINNDKIQILSIHNRAGRPVLKERVAISLDPGSIINGVIIRKEPIVEELAKRKGLLKGCRVAINSSNIFIKKMAYPKLTKQQLFKVMVNEFSLVEDQHILYDADRCRRSKQNVAIFSATPVELVRSYLEVFKEAGIKPGRMENVSNAVIRYIRSKEVLQDKTFILNILDSGNLVSLLFEKGDYLLTNRSRVAVDEAGVMLTDSFISSLSNIIQFNKSEKSENEIETSYYAGLHKDQLKALQEDCASRGINVGISDFEELIDFQAVGSEYFYLYAVLVNKSGDVNLLESYNRWKRAEKVKRENKLAWRILTGFLLLLLVFGSYTYLRLTNYGAEVQNVRMYDYLYAEGSNASVEQLIEKERSNADFPRSLEEIAGSLNESKALRAVAVKVVFDAVYSADPSIVIDSVNYNATDKSVKISATGGSEQSGSLFITKLKATGLFESIVYGGYSVNAQNRYVFTVNAVIK